MLGFITLIEVCYISLSTLSSPNVPSHFFCAQNRRVAVERGSEAWKVGGDDGIQGPEIVIMGLEYEAEERWHPMLEVSQ